MTITWQSSNFWATLYSQCLHYAWASNRLYGREYGRPSARRVATEINRFWRLRDRLRRRTTWKNLSSRRPTSPMRSQDTRLTRRRASDWWNILSEHLPVVHTHTHTHEMTCMPSCSMSWLWDDGWLHRRRMILSVGFISLLPFPGSSSSVQRGTGIQLEPRRGDAVAMASWAGVYGEGRSGQNQGVWWTVTDRVVSRRCEHLISGSWWSELRKSDVFAYTLYSLWMNV